MGSRPTPGRITGLSLTELLVVVSIIGLLALTAAPHLASTDSPRLDLSTEEVAAALRFARSEALRTGTPHGLHASTTSQQLRLYRLDTSASPPAPSYTVRNPLDKKLYTLDFTSAPRFGGISLADRYFKFQAIALTVDTLSFDNRGRPFYDDGTRRELETATLTLSFQGQQRQVQVAPVTGRVTWQ